MNHESQTAVPLLAPEISKVIQVVKKPKLIDQYYERIGYSSYQIFQTVIACLINIVLGVESLLLNLIVVQLQIEWQIQSVHTAALVASFGLGTGVGGYFSGYLADNYGRKNIILYSLVFMVIFGFASSYIYNFYVFLCFRFLVSCGVGIVKMIITSFLIEWLPKKNRSLVMSVTQLYSVGNIIINLVALACIQDNQLIYWRWLIRISSGLTIICVLLMAFFSDESPKFLLSKMNFDNAFKSLEKIAKNKNFHLTDEEKNIIKGEIVREEAHQIKTSVFVMFSSVFLRSSILLIGIRFLSSLINAGNLYILPLILGHSNHNSDHHGNDGNFNQYDAIFGYFLSNLIAVPSPILRGFLSEIKFLGRKYTLFLSCVLGSLTIALSIIFFNYLSLFSGISRMAFTATTGLLNIYTVEIFPTKIRTLSLGFINSITRLGPIVAPFICSGLEDWFFMGSFYFFGISGVLCCFMSVLLPIEPIDHYLDDMGALKRKNTDEIKTVIRSDSSSSLEVLIIKSDK